MSRRQTKGRSSRGAPKGTRTLGPDDVRAMIGAAIPDSMVRVLVQLEALGPGIAAVFVRTFALQLDGASRVLVGALEALAAQPDPTATAMLERLRAAAAQFKRTIGGGS